MTTHDKLAAAREEGRNQGLREAAEVASEHADLLRTKSADRAYNDACFNIEDAILALIAASAPIQPDGDELRELADEDRKWIDAPNIFVNTYEVESTRLLDADEREALVTVIGNGIFATPADHEAIDLARNIADALLAAGWTRKRDLLK